MRERLSTASARCAGASSPRAGRRASPSTTARRSTRRSSSPTSPASSGSRRDGEPFVVGLQNEPGRTRVALYKTGGKVELGEAMPTLEDLGLRVVEEVPTRLLGGDGDTWVQDFGVLGPGDRPLDLADVGDRVADCIAAVRRGDAESDTLNRLVLVAGLNWRQVNILRAYRMYRQRIGSRFTQGYQNDVLAANPELTAKLMRYFELRFDPDQPRDEDAEVGAARRDPRRPRRGRLARPRPHPAQPARADRRDAAHQRVQPRPRGHRVQAALGRRARDPAARAAVRDLRLLARDGGDPPARRQGRARRHPLVGPDGLPHRGLRPDARADDQERGDRPRRREGRLLPQAAARGPRRAQGRGRAPVRPLHRRAARADRQPGRGQGRATPTACACSTTTTRTSSSPPTRARRRSPTPPTGSARSAASGSATRSPPAARAATTTRRSGITARGAWESVKRHFSELGVDVATEPFTVVGIGDMSGDVFGNGMLLSDRIRLVGAYDHRHVFIDPDPDPDAGFAERKRLFELRRLELGRLRPRRRSPRAAASGRAPPSRSRCRRRRARRSGVEDERLAPNDLIRAILRAPVDLLWNGGIGTVVKASDETDARRDGPRVRRDPRRRARPALPRRRRGRQPRPHPPRARGVRARGRADQRRLHRQLGRRRLLRPRGQPEDPARPRRAARRARPAGARRAAARGDRRRRRARALRLVPAGADPRPRRSWSRKHAHVRVRGPDGGARAARAARPRVRGAAGRPRRSPSAAAPGAGSSGRSSRCCSPTPSGRSRATCSPRTSARTRGWSATCATTSPTASSSASATCSPSTRCGAS